MRHATGGRFTCASALPLPGVELLNDGGYFTMALDAEANQPARFIFHPLKR